MPAPVYITRAGLIARKVPCSSLTEWPHSRLNRVIWSVCSWLDTFTTQHFNHITEKYAVHGEGRSHVQREDMLPIVKLFGLAVDPMKTDAPGQSIYDRYINYGQQSVEQWTLFPQRLPRMVQTPGRFPRGRGNIVLDGVFGWLWEHGRKSIEALTASAVTPSSTTVVFDRSIDDMEVGDVFQLDRRFNRIAEDINYGTRTVTFEPLEGLTKRTLLSGVKAECYGAPKPEATEVCTWFFQRTLEMDFTREDLAQMDPSALKGETVDNYKWERMSPAQLVGFGRSAGLIGVPEIDQRLQDLMPPAQSIIIPGRTNEWLT